MSGQFAAAHGLNFTQNRLGERMADRDHDGFAAHLADGLDGAAGGADVVDDAWDMPRRGRCGDESCAGDDWDKVVGLDEIALLIDEHRTVGIPVEDDATIEVLFTNDLGQLLTGGGRQRIRTVVRERAVQRVIQEHGAGEEIMREE